MLKIMKELKTIEELDKLLTEQDSTLAIVKVGAHWCGSCKMLERTISEIEPTLEGVEFYAVDVDEADEELVERFQVQSVPVLLFFNEGLQVDRVLGARSKSYLLEIINKNK